MTVLVTGATGFVGRRLLPRLLRDGFQVRAAARDPLKVPVDPGIEAVPIPSLEENVNWRPILEGVDTVIHLAARVHNMQDDADAWPLYRAVNEEATAHLASHASAAGVQRFVFLSTSKVYGESSKIGRPLSEDAPLQPQGPYAASKARAELRLTDFADRMSVATIRTPVVYGPEAGGNIERLMRLLQKRLPLPLANTRNLRSIISVDNLSDVLAAACSIQPPGLSTFNVSDGADISTTQLVRTLARGLQIRPQLFPVPHALVRALAHSPADQLTQRLWGTFQLNTARVKEQFRWSAPNSTEAELLACAHAYTKRGFA